MTLDPLKTRKILSAHAVEWLESLQPLDLRELLYSYVKRSAFFGMTEPQILSQVVLDKAGRSGASWFAHQGGSPEVGLR